MAEYSVMLVDDEAEVRETIIRKLNWEEIGFKVIGHAENGEEALEILDGMMPDVVMTDIHMPFMDGLTLCKKIKEISKNTKIVIFSGYDEFEYAKEAIKLEVEEYILKPIDSEELRMVFKRIKNTLDEEIAQKNDVRELKKYYYESLPVMREQFLCRLLEGKMNELRINELKGIYDKELESAYYAVANIGIDSNALEEAQKLEDDIVFAQLLPLSLKRIAEENLGNLIKYRCFLYFERVIVIAMLDYEGEIISFIKSIDQICKTSNRVLEANTSAGIGKVCTSLSEISGAYKGAESAYEYRILLEPNQAIYIQDIEPARYEATAIEDIEIQGIMKCIKIGTTEELQKAVNNLINKVKVSKMNLSQFQLSFLEIFVELTRLSRTYKVDIENIIGDEHDLYKSIKRFDSLEELEQYLLEVCVKLRHLIRMERTDTTKLLAESAIQYINENYANPELSVDMLCNELNVSAAYFSTIFKRETGKGFVSYLTKTRMEQALKLLNTTTKKTYIIAGEVGYAEPNYFSYVFKKEYGISPSKYRTSKVEQNEG